MGKFKFKSQVCTTIEQSERLVKLGLKKDTADMHLNFMCGMNANVAIAYNELHSVHEKYIKPAWSLNRLMELIPGDFRESYFSLSQRDVGYSTGAHEWTYFKEGNIYDCMIDCIEWLIRQGGIAQGYLEEKK